MSPATRDFIAGLVYTQIEARSLDTLQLEDLLDAVGTVLSDFEIPHVREDPSTHGEDAIPVFVPVTGTGILVDFASGGRADLAAIQRCTRQDRLVHLVVLTPISPDVYPAGHRERGTVHGKQLSVIRTRCRRSAASPDPASPPPWDEPQHPGEPDLSRPWCYAIIDGQHDPGRGYVPSVIVENDPGHYPMRGGPGQAPWYWGETIEAARDLCRRINAERGVTEDEALRILASSMGAQNRAAGDRPR